jgi:molecular chaperone DnaK (HSP70)
MSAKRVRRRSRFIVGIDLGTTNSVLAYSDAEGTDEGPIELLEIPQLVAPGSVEARTQLPSFLRMPGGGDNDESVRLPWGQPEGGRVVGTLAARRASEEPERVVASAKSWLCHDGVDRRAAILPWVGDGASGEGRISPLEASADYLVHLREAWDASLGQQHDAPLCDQDVHLTVPASFDAAARELTVEAARMAGLEEVRLLEEPQAAVYAWLDRMGDGWREQVGVGDVLLVCDIGGGTTDLSLVLVDEEEGALALTRVAVGNHILLGGDNMDLALAYAVRSELAREGKKIDAWQLRGLVQGCREGKERLLAAKSGKKAVPLSILGRGKKLIGGTLRTELTATQVEGVLVDGFFPMVEAEARVDRSASSGLSELGLPFASDPAITRHLSEFLLQAQGALEAARPGAASSMPTAILFNGGVMAASSVRTRVESVLASWARASGAAAPRVLEGADHSHAVARGAAAYGRARRGSGVRIRGGTARSYYVGVASAMPSVPGQTPPVKGLCVVPFGIEEGTELEIPGSEFGLLVGEAAEFRFFASTSRAEDAPGQILDEFETEDLEELSPLHLALEGDGGARVPVRLQAHVTEIGTLELFFAERQGERRWRLEFMVREASKEA